ncbi:MAG: hypothetical protein II264_03085, partial [Ruminococcus sp.]|nr:hypothetical protein [Ruminococcus sp.]
MQILKEHLSELFWRIDVEFLTRVEVNCLLELVYLLQPSEKDYSDETLCTVYDVTMPAAESEEDKKFCPLAVYDKLCDRLENEIKANGQEKLLREIEIPL